MRGRTPQRLRAWCTWAVLATATAAAAQQRYYPAENTSELNRHLSPACATLNDAIATASRQGQWATAQAARREFEGKCSHEVQQAAERRWQQQQGERERWREQQRQNEQARQQEADFTQQCQGMRELLALRRKRERDNALNEQEVAALRQFEVQFNERCVRR